MKRYSTSTALLTVLLYALLVPFVRAEEGGLRQTRNWFAGAEAHSAAFESAREKFDWIARNGESSTPSTEPTVLNAREWNAYLNEGGVKLPEGLSKMRISSEPGIAHG